MFVLLDVAREKAEKLPLCCKKQNFVVKTLFKAALSIERELMKDMRQEFLNATCNRHKKFFFVCDVACMVCHLICHLAIAAARCQLS